MTGRAHRVTSCARHLLRWLAPAVNPFASPVNIAFISGAQPVSMTSAPNLPATTRAFTGALLLVFPFLIQIPYGILTANFEYPNILRQPADVILRRYAEGGLALTSIWYLFAISILPLLAGITLLPAVASTARPQWLKAATPLGVASAVLQMLGLLRWVVLVPLLAKAYMEPSATSAQREAIEVAFLVQHQLFGVLMGEHLGQMLLALWTAGVVLSLAAGTRLQQVQRWMGLCASVLFLIGSAESLASVFPALSALAVVPAIAFLLWSVWCGLLGWLVLRNGTGPEIAAILLGRHAQPAAEITMQNARLRETE